VPGPRKLRSDSPVDRERPTHPVKREDISLAVRISAALAVATVALIIFVVGGSIVAARTRDRNSLRTELERTTDQLAVGLSLPLWNFDQPQLDDLLESVMQREEVYSVEVNQVDPTAPSGRATHRRVRGPDWKSVSDTQTPASFELFFAERDVPSPEGPIGRVRVSVTSKFLEERLRARLLFLVLQVTSLALLIILGLYLLLWRIVIEPLRMLDRFAQEVSAAPPGEPFELGSQRSDRPFYGELKSLRTSIMSSFHELRARQASLQENEVMLSSILNSVPQGVFWKTRDGAYLGCNQVFARTAGLKNPDEIVGKTDFDLPDRSPEEAEAYRAQDLKIIETGEAQTHIVRERKDEDGATRVIDTTKVPLRDSAGQTFGVLGVSDDITQQRRVENERRDLEAQLRQSQKVEVIGALAGGIAHDFNNLLTAIRGNAEMAMRDLDPGHPAYECAVEIENVTRRAAELVRQIVGFSRPTEAVVEAVSLKRLVVEVMRLMRSVLPASIELTSHTPEASPSVMGDSSQLHQVLVNLCTNAWQAMDNGPGRIEIGLETRTFAETGPQDLPPGSYACLTVADDGPGMSREIKDRIFEPFFTTRSGSGGTGLGLSTARGILSANHGAIEVESNPGSGSRFTIFLPATQKAPAIHAPRAVVKADAPRRVYYVDDEEVIVFLATRQLARRGHTVRGFTSAETALEAIRQDPAAFDVLVTDYNMPRMPGLALVNLVLQARPDARIVLTTGYLSEVVRGAAARMNIRWIIEKPSSTDELCDAINKCALGLAPENEATA